MDSETMSTAPIIADDAPAYLRAAMASPCISDLFGIRMVAWGKGTVTLAVDHRPELGHIPGWFQGAVTSAIAEYAAALSGVTFAPELRAATLQQTIEFTGAARGRRLIAVGRLVSGGEKISITRAEVSVERDDALHPCATLTMKLGHRAPKTQTE